MKPLDYYFDTPASGPGHYPQWFAALFAGLVRIAFKLVFRYKVYGLEHIKNLPPESAGGAILAANHRSYLDPVFLFPIIRPRPVRFMAKEEFFSVNPIVARGSASLGVFPVRRNTADMEAIKRAVKMLKRGELVGIFPEGTRIRRTGQEVQYHEGVSLIAGLAKAPVIPLRIWNTDKICPEGKRFFRFPRITLAFGEPLWITDEPFASMPKEQRYPTFVDALMERIYAIEAPRKV